MDISPEDLTKARDQMRAAWRASHPDAPESDMPEALRAAEADATPEERPTRAYLSALFKNLKDLVGSTISREDFDAAHRSAMSSAGGKASAAKKRAAKQEASEPRGFAEHNGFLVALWLQPGTAEQLAIPGGEPAEALHVTLCYCGDLADVDDLTVARAISRIESLVSYRAPVEGQVAGYGRFNASESSDALDVFYAAADIPGLEDLRHEIAWELQWAGLPPLQNHGFTPHITLAYLDPELANPADKAPALSLRFSALTIMAGSRRIDIPLRGFGPMLYSTTAKGAPWKLFSELPHGFAEAPEWVNVLPVPGVYSHASYGKILITEERNQRFIDNFNARVYQQDLPITIDIEHDSKMSGAQGYIAEMRLNANGSVDARIEWTERGRQLIEEDRFRYFSPEWWDVWSPPGGTAVYQDVLIGGAICVRPFFKEDVLAPLVASEDQLYAAKPGTTGPYPEMVRLDAATTKEGIMSDKTTTLTEAEVQEFRELKAKHAEREQAFADQATKLADLEAAKTANDEKIAALERERRERKFTDTVMGKGGEADGAVWPGAIKDNVAELVALAEAVGEDSPIFTSYVARMNETAKTLKASEAFRPIGTSRTNDDDTGAAAEVRKLAEAKRTADPKLTIEQAEAQVYAEQPELYERLLAGE